jgi:toxin ParE1/3/4
LLEAPLRFAALQGFEAVGFRRRIFGRFAIVYALIAQDVFIVRIVATDMDLGLALSID